MRIICHQVILHIFTCRGSAQVFCRTSSNRTRFEAQDRQEAGRGSQNRREKISSHWFLFLSTAIYGQRHKEKVRQVNTQETNATTMRLCFQSKKRQLLKVIDTIALRPDRTGPDVIIQSDRLVGCCH
jgi:hypothetical protein